MISEEKLSSGWWFLSNHGFTFLYLASHPDATMREVAAAVGITERAVGNLIRDLVKEGYLTVEKHGRRNSYKVERRRNMRHPMVRDLQVSRLLDSLSHENGTGAAPS